MSIKNKYEKALKYINSIRNDSTIKLDRMKELMEDKNNKTNYNTIVYDNRIENCDTIIESLQKEIPIEVELDEVNRGIGVSGEYDIEFNMLCSHCKTCVGDYDSEELYYKYCPECGQKLKWDSSLHE